jgi:hypothetical protein
MERKTSRNLYLAGLILAIIATVLLVVSTVVLAAGSTVNADGTLNTTAGTGIGILAIVASVVYIVAAVLLLVAWIGALIKSARLSQWMWFVLLLLFSGITMLVYIFAGPTEPKLAAPATAA